MTPFCKQARAVDAVIGRCGNQVERYALLCYLLSKCSSLAVEFADGDLSELARELVATRRRLEDAAEAPRTDIEATLNAVVLHWQKTN